MRAGTASGVALARRTLWLALDGLPAADCTRWLAEFRGNWPAEDAPLVRTMPLDLMMTSLEGAGAEEIPDAALVVVPRQECVRSTDARWRRCTGRGSGRCF